MKNSRKMLSAKYPKIKPPFNIGESRFKDIGLHPHFKISVLSSGLSKNSPNLHTIL